MAEIKGKWVKLEQNGKGPGARSSHAIAVVGKKAYAFGGEFSPRIPVDNMLHVFDMEDGTWSISKVLEGTPPLPRVGVTMVAAGQNIYVFGGRDAEHKELNEFYSFDTSTNRWSLLPSSDDRCSPPPRSYHSMTADESHVYVFGGCGVSGRLNDLWAFDIAAKKWAELPEPGSSCLPRGGAGLVVSSGKIWVVYGFSGNELDDVHCFDPKTGTWKVVETSGDKPSARSVFSSVGIGKHVILYGGEIDPSDLGHLGAGSFSEQVFALDTETCVWKKVEVEAESSGENPGPRGWCAFSVGKKGGREGLLVYGGNSPTNDRLGDLFFFTPSL